MSAERTTIGVIHRDEAYTVDEFRARTGLGYHAWRQLRPQLQVEIGKKRFVRGADWLDYLARAAQNDEVKRRFGPESECIATHPGCYEIRVSGQTIGRGRNFQEALTTAQRHISDQAGARAAPANQSE